MNTYGQPTPHFLEIDVVGADVHVAIAPEFAGRNVSEDMPLSELQNLLNESTKYDDLLGLIFESNEDEIHGFIGIGSGNERFRIRKSDLRAALES